MGRTNIIITGVGGQGIITAGLLIGNAVTSAGLNAVMSEIHGMSQRGGGVTVEMRIGDVYGPITPRGDVDLVLGFEALETLRVMNRASAGATVIMNKEELVPVTVNVGDAKYPDIERAVSKLNETGVRLYAIDSRKLAVEAGNRLSSNVVLVGAAYEAGFIPVELSFLQGSVKKMFPERSWGTNVKALELGMQELRHLRDESRAKPGLATPPSPA